MCNVMLLSYIFSLGKRSWFGAFMGAGSEKDDHHFVVIKDRTFSEIKADLIHAFLCVGSSCFPNVRVRLAGAISLFVSSQSPDLIHNVISSTTFRAEYRRGGGSSILSRNVKFEVEVSRAHTDKTSHDSSSRMHCVTFTLISGEFSA